MNTKDRMKQFLEHLGIGQKKFEGLCGLSNGFVDKIGDNIHRDNISKISNRYPELNITWLKTGEGSMLHLPKLGTEEAVDSTWERAKTIALQRALAKFGAMVYQLKGVDRSVTDIFDDIDNDTELILADLRKSEKKGS